MSKGHIVALLLAMAALVFGIPLMVAPQLFPDLGRPILWLLFIGGIVVTAGLLGLAAYVAIDKDPAAKWRRRASGFRGKVIRRTISAAIILGFVIWYLLPLDPLRNQLPGFTAYAVISLENPSDFHRKYVFTFGPNGIPRAEFYMSASGEYTFSVTDIHGEKYPLETNIGPDGIPQYKFIGLFNQVGLTEKTTILRITVNNREVIRRTLPFAIDLGDTKWPPIILGGGASFKLTEFASFASSLPNKTISALWANVQSFYKM